MKLKNNPLQVHNFKASDAFWVLSEAALQYHDYHITTTTIPV